MVSRTAVRALGVGVLVLAFSAAVVSSVAAKPSGPGPGNSPNAKQCHNGGWQNLVTSTGQSFTSEGACTSYAAGGGTLAPAPTYEQQWQTTCENGGGSFNTNGVGTQWQCHADPDFPLSQATYDALATTCSAAGGTTVGLPIGFDWTDIACDFF